MAGAGGDGASSHTGDANSGESANSVVDWVTVHRKRRRCDNDSPVALLNSFGPLANLPAGDMTSADNGHNAMNVDDQNSEPKPPAFFLRDCVTKIESMLNEFLNITEKDSFVYKCVGDDIKINATTIKNYNILTHFCKTKNIPFFTYQIRSQKAFKVIFKNLHHSYPSDSLKEEIEAKGHKVRRINSMWNKRLNSPFNMFMVELEPSGNNKDIYNIKAIDHCVVQVEAPHKKRELVQCTRCQAYNHTKNFCNLQPRCVKCGEDHFTKECKVASSVAPVCANCNDNHTANYKGCPVYQRKATFARGPQRNQPADRTAFNMRDHNFPQMRRADPTPSSHHIPPQEVSYADVTKNDNHMARIERILERQMEITNNLFMLMTQLMEKLCHK